MNVINRKPRILDRVLAGLTMLSLIISLSYGTFGAFTVHATVDEPDTCGEVYTYTFVSIDNGNYGKDSSKPANVDFENSASPGKPDKITVTADLGYIITKVELDVNDDGTDGFVTASLPVTNYNPNGKDIWEAKITVRKDCVDLCPNIGGDQTEIPNGMYTNDEDDCIDIPTVTICHATGGPNYVANSPNKTADAGGHAGIEHQDGEDIIPPFAITDGGSFAGQNWDAEGQAIFNNGTCDGVYTPPVTDVCKNIDGIQSEIPTGMTVNNAGDCVTPPTDVCPNIPELQTEVPTGYTLTNNECIAPTDVCKNIDGIQSEIPAGMTVNNTGDCVTPPTDVCPNIPELQTEVPTGYTLTNNECVLIPPPTPTCNDNIQNQNETGIDTGGVCSPTPVCENESATNYHDSLPCEFDEPEVVVNTCLTPSAKGHDKAFTVGTSGETKLQDILTNAKYTVNVNSDQKNYQVWDFSTPNTDKVTFNVKILAKEAGNIETFGYYKAGDTSTFVPVFTIPPSSVGNTFAITVDSTFAASIGFAVQTSPLEPNTWYSEKALNTDGKDNVAVYNPSANTYVIAFEDLKNFDNDFNDLVVEVTAVTCVPEETKQCLVVSDATTLVDGVASTLTWVHPAWTTGLNAGTAEWIWDNTIAPRTGETVTFTKKFNVDNTPTGATLKVTADNSYTVSLNGNPLSCDGSGIDNFTSVDTCTATVLAGVNTLTFVAVNAPWDTDDVQVNPSGLIYELTINGSSCSPIPVEENPYGECISAENLLKNGSFEEPSIAEITIKWGPITDPLGWIVKKVADATNATLEFHRGVFGNEAAEGEQYVELDGEEADRISQTVTTEKGALYKLFWAFAPRLEYVNDASNQNQISVQVNGIQVATEGPATANFGVLDRQDWTRSSYQFTAKSENTEIAFADNGSPSDGYGAYLDNAYLCKVRNPVIDGGDTPTQVRGGGGALNRTGETRGDSDSREKKDTKDRDDKPSGDVEGVQTSKVPTVAGASTGAGGTSPSSPTNLPLMTLMTMLASVSTRGKVKINEK